MDMMIIHSGRLTSAKWLSVSHHIRVSVSWRHNYLSAGNMLYRALP
jgi:hypothetical protein